MFVQAKDMLEFGPAVVRSYHAETAVSVEPATSSERQRTRERVPRLLPQQDQK